MHQGLIKEKMIKKIIIASMGLSLALGLTLAPAPVRAQSMSLPQLVDLFIQLGIIAPDKAAAAKAAVTSSGSASMTYTRDLTVGSSGADVTALQTQLGVSPATGYFGSITKAAVAQYQAANGLPATGYFGPLTRAKLNGSAVVTTPSTPTAPTTPTAPIASADEGYLDRFQKVSSISSEEIGEGEKNVKVLGIEMRAQDADQSIDRVIVEIKDPTGNDDLDEFIDNVSVWLDNKELGRMNVSRASHSRSSDTYTFRFTGLNGVIREDDTAKLYVAVNGVRRVSSGDIGDGWTVRVPTNGIRVLSPNSTDEMYANSAYAETFTIESFASARGVKMRISKANSSPEAQTIEVSETRDTDGVELLSFDIEAEGSDITILDLPILLTSVGANVTDIASRLTLEIDGEDYSENVASSTATTELMVTFDDIDLTIDEGDTVTVVVKADIKDFDGSFGGGDTLKADVSSLMREYIEAEDETGEDIAANAKTGSATGEVQTFYVNGINVKRISASAASSDESDTLKGTRGVYTVKFDVTAFGGDAYIASTTALAGASGDHGVEFNVTGHTLDGAATLTSNLSSTADRKNASFLVQEGRTETFTLTVVILNGAAPSGFFGIELDTIRFDDADTADISAYDTYTSSLRDIETEQIYLQ